MRSEEPISPLSLLCQGSLSSLIGSISHFLAPEAKFSVSQQRKREREFGDWRLLRRYEGRRLRTRSEDWGFACDGADPFNRHCRFHLIQNPFKFSRFSLYPSRTPVLLLLLFFLPRFGGFSSRFGPELPVWLPHIGVFSVLRVQWKEAEPIDMHMLSWFCFWLSLWRLPWQDRFLLVMVAKIVELISGGAIWRAPLKTVVLWGCPCYWLHFHAAWTFALGSEGLLQGEETREVRVPRTRTSMERFIQSRIPWV